jgi:hypothetical protein
VAVGLGWLVGHAFDFHAHCRLSHEKLHLAVLTRYSLKLGAPVKITSVERFVRFLKQSPAGAVFNPWWEIDAQHDIAGSAPMIRRRQLRAYLHQRFGCARTVVIGEALGYRGGHFTGIPMTSERMLLGKQANIANDRARRPLQIVSGITLRRTSKPTVCTDGFSEPTATIVWGAMLNTGVLPDEFVLWNAFPWHSFDPRRGLLSNRTPNEYEQACGRPVLCEFFKLFPCQQIIALGKIAAAQLEQLGVVTHCVRHPASGGAKLFRAQIASIIR